MKVGGNDKSNKNTRSTFGVLGMDKAYVAGFDEDILMTLGMAPTE